MNLRVTDGTGLILRCLVMKRRCARRMEIHGCGMALQAQCIYVAHIQQARVRRAVRRMARGATLSLDHRMFVDERAGVFGMAPGAGCVLVGGNPQLVLLERAMGIVAIRAAHQAFFYLVMKRLCESRFDIAMAGEAKGWLRKLEQIRRSLRIVDIIPANEPCGLLRGALAQRRFKGMNAVAAGAGNTRFSVRRTLIVWVRCSVAAEARGIDLFFRRLGEAKDLGRVSTGIDMGFPWSMAAFTGRALAPVHQCQT